MSGRCLSIVMIVIIAAAADAGAQQTRRGGGVSASGLQGGSAGAAAAPSRDAVDAPAVYGLRRNHLVTALENTERNPRMAHDTKRNRYLVVWDEEETPGTGVPRDIRGFLVSADGTRTGVRLDIDTIDHDDLAPDVAYNAATDEFLVVWEYADTATDHDIIGRRIHAGTLAMEGFTDVVTTTASQAKPIVVANPLPGQTNRWFIAWEERPEPNGTVSDHIYGQFLNASGGAGSPAAPFLISSSLANLDDAHVRAAFNPVSGKYQVVYASTDASNTDVRLVTVNGQTGALELPDVLSACGASCDAATEPDVAWNVWTGEALVVWKDSRASDPPLVNALVGRRFDEVDLLSGEFVILAGDSASPNLEPSVTPQFAGGWSVWYGRSTETTSGNNDLDIKVHHLSADVGPGSGWAAGPTDVTVDAATSPVGDDRLPAAMLNPYYGWLHGQYESAYSAADHDIYGARVSAGTFPLQTAHANFDGVGGTDRAVVRLNSDGTVAWFVNQSSGGATGMTWGGVGDIPVAGDYDGDGTADVAVWRPSDGGWYLVHSSTGMGVGRAFGAGAEGDIPVPADYDGDGKTDMAVYRPGAVGAFYIIRSSTGAGVGAAWGTWGDIPVPGDYDGDGKADLGVWRPSAGTFFVIRSSTGAAFARTWGAAGDQPLIGDFDGDGIDDIAVFRPVVGPTSAAWFVIASSTGAATATIWGDWGDTPVPADYDNDGKTDIAVWRQGSPASTFFIIQSGGGGAVGIQWGTVLDLPIAR